MLHNVPTQIGRTVRAVVANHPNAFSCQVWRKEVLRKADDEFAGKPTFGGIGVIDSGDEEDYKYNFIGNGYVLPAEQFQPAPVNDAQDANVGASDDFLFIIISEAQTSEEGYFEPQNHDVVYVLLGERPNEAKLAYEIVSLETTINISPYIQRYRCNRRGDMDISIDENPDNFPDEEEPEEGEEDEE